jgi:polar amino acid transport system substrate-binding protein
MRGLISRRAVIGSGSALVLALAARPLPAQGQGLLARLQAAKKVKVGFANQPPFSALNPDGSVTGIAPTISKQIMTRLGVPQMEGAIATYGELIPGMQAGRWDFVSASLTINKQRCSQVKFSDPIVFDGTAIVSLKGALPNPPKLIADIVRDKIVIGVQSGGANSRAALAAGVDQANMLQFPNDAAIIDGLLAKRIQVAFGSNSSLKVAYGMRNLDVVVTYPVADGPANGSGCAFRPDDTDLYDAYQRELRAMKASGEYQQIMKQFGFDPPPPEQLNMTAEQACQVAIG